MAINAERLYENAKENLRLACISVHKGDEKDGDGLFRLMQKDPELYMKASDRYLWADALPALEIYSMAKDELGKAKGGTAYSAVKRFLKGCSPARPDLNGVWYDAEGRQCMCDGYHAMRLRNPVDGFNEVKGMDLKTVWAGEDDNNTELSIPTPGEVKINKKKLARGTDGYDFGDGLPMVNAAYLKDIMDCLPNAKAYVDPRCGELSSIFFRSEDGDALLLPIRKRSA